MKKCLIILCSLFCLSITSLTYAQKFVETQGAAPILDGATAAAKELAIRDAIRQAMLQTKATVDSRSLVADNVLIIESSRVNAAGTVEDVKVIDEWIDDDIYYVRIRAHVPSHKQRKASAAARYRKKVAVLQFDIIDRRQTYDMPSIEQEMPRELIRRLENSGEFIGIDASQYLITRQTATANLDDPRRYVQFAEFVDAQILVTGVIRDMGITEGFIRNSRRIEIDVFIYDGISGARIAKHRFSENVPSGKRFTATDIQFSQSNFANSKFGKALNRVLDRQAEMVSADLLDLPFSARIIKIEGKEILFNAGSKSLVQIGDSLMTYRLEASPITTPAQQFLGFKETPIATLAVQQVQPHFSIGKLETDKAKLYPGDIIRFGWLE